ncbi:MAG: benzoyl-CoA 2,3-epoxidase subunit BoxB [Ilumatobacter sp.]|uniref:benzoyl-CoA 2,3-epoxidase subunit BoxB n=1 Tax=Ilumatobacter sp. TaxID=1967498 RepID=UPI00260D97E3|nr:benzoyl-CoA 2,3-epoxidase subunit BoxB [Ilumatobacter sp.]MDJ0767917.1 benzoyl-CoA 2,3-epoxidase subunit BoxB [Ilumatobacter sp.]
MTLVDIDATIPNNVGLADDRRLRRALENWQPKFLQWWRDLGPVAFQENPVYLRTAVSVGREGWANFDHVEMPDYRWGVFLAEPEPDRTIAFGDHKGDAVWQEVPGEYRADLRRLLVVQGDTEPASVEQQRHLCLTAPSLYDMRNLFQVNVEEGRHLWAMVYLLHRYFGRDGRDEAELMLERHSGDLDNPRILGAFNEQTPDWLSFFMFTYFTDRDGKYQLASLRESGFDPLSRTCDFMLKEEAHHMFVGATGVGRVVERTVELMKEHDTDEVSRFGGIDLATIQKYMNFHFSVSLDLFGAETSTNAANYFAAGLKGRFKEEARDDDHQLHGLTRTVPTVDDDGRIGEREATQLAALNETLREDYVEDCQKGVDRWNRALADVGVELRLPHSGFNRAVGEFRDHRVGPDGRVISDEEWAASVDGWLPTDADREHVESLMVGVTEPGKMAGWVAAPSTGIHQQPVDFEYVRI